MNNLNTLQTSDKIEKLKSKRIKYRKSNLITIHNHSNVDRNVKTKM